MKNLADPNSPVSQRLLAGVRALTWLCAVLGVLLAGSIIRSYVLQDHINDVETVLQRTESAVNSTEDVASAARVSADAALAELRAAIRAIEENRTDEPELTNQAILSALEAIARIEAFICNGECPEPG